MEEKELLSQLNNLKNIKPDSAWKKQSRDILLSQISGGDYEPLPPKPAGFSLQYYFKTFFHQPVLVVAAILLVVMGGGIFSVNASRDTKPGDSLYIAKIVSEKTRAAITFDEGDKAKLGIEFAGNRAKELAQVMSEEGNGDKEEKAEKLAQNFKKEISAAKENLKKVNIIKEENDEESDNKGENTEQEEEMGIFSANLGKNDKGMQIYNPNADKEDNIEQEEIIEEPAQGGEQIASSTSESSGDVERVLEEAEKLFDEKNYDGTLTKLEEANALIDNAGENNLEKVDEQNNNQATTTEVDVLGAEEEAAPEAGE